MSDEYKSINLCLCCQEKNIPFFDLGNQPLANNYCAQDIACTEYPLKLMYCPNCCHCQLSHAVNPEILFKTYKYVSGTSQTGINFFKDNAQFIHDYKGITCGTVLDIASNDGTQLDFFKNLGWITYGVDPATNLYETAKSKGHNIVCDFWNENVAKTLPIMNVITAQNVFAHTCDVDEFLQSCKLIMDNKSSLFIQTSQKNMIINAEFDTIYHEHISFYNTMSMQKLVERNGLFLNRVMEVPIHGVSYIFEIGKVMNEKICNVAEQLKCETAKNFYSPKTYSDFEFKARQVVSDLRLTLAEYGSKGYKKIGFGAAAKGQTVLCYGNIHLEYIIDENPLKIGLYSPKQKIPIVSIDKFVTDEHRKFVIVILAWNFSAEIKEKINKYKEKKNVVIIEAYFPSIVISP